MLGASGKGWQHNGTQRGAASAGNFRQYRGDQLEPDVDEPCRSQPPSNAKRSKTLFFYAYGTKNSELFGYAMCKIKTFVFVYRVSNGQSQYFRWFLTFAGSASGSLKDIFT
jgi:hypothetical protein